MPRFCYGWHQPLPIRPKLCFAPKHASLDALPQELDWAMKYRNWPAVYNQYQTSSCVGQGLKRVVHTLQIEQGLPQVIEPSSSFIYYNARELEGSADQDCGANVCDGMLSLVVEGFCAEKDWPLAPVFITVRPSYPAYEAAQQHRIDDYAPALVDNTNIQAFLEALNVRPLVGGIVCFNSFQAPDVIRTGLVRMPGLDESEEGGHCMFYRGYSIPRRTIFFDNSWGPEYGIRGTGEIPFEYIQRFGSDFWLALKVS